MSFVNSCRYGTLFPKKNKNHQSAHYIGQVGLATSRTRPKMADCHCVRPFRAHSALEALPLELIAHIVALSEPSVVIQPPPPALRAARATDGGGGGGGDGALAPHGGACTHSRAVATWRLPAVCATSTRLSEAAGHASLTLRFHNVRLHSAPRLSAPIWRGLVRAACETPLPLSARLVGELVSVVEFSGTTELSGAACALADAGVLQSVRLVTREPLCSGGAAACAAAGGGSTTLARSAPALTALVESSVSVESALCAHLLGAASVSPSPPSGCACLPGGGLSSLKYLSLPNLRAPGLSVGRLLRQLHTSAAGGSLRALFLGGAQFQRPLADSPALGSAPAAAEVGAADAAEAAPPPGAGAAAAAAAGLLLPGCTLVDATYWRPRELDAAGALLAHGHGAIITLTSLEGVRRLHEFVMREAHAPARAAAAARGHAASAPPPLAPAEDARLLRTAVAAALGARDGARWTPLHEAAAGGSAHARAPQHCATARLLIALGAAVNCKDARGATPLFRAAFAGDLCSVRALLDARADATLRNHSREAPLYIAALRGHVGVVRTLTHHLMLGRDGGAVGGDGDGRGDDGDGGGCEGGAQNGGAADECARPGAEAGVWAPDQGPAAALAPSSYHDGWTPLHAAAIAKSPELVSLLLTCGFDARARNRHLQTAAHVAARMGCAECLRVLVSSTGRAALADRDEHGSTVLSVVKTHCPAALRLLEASGMLPRVAGSSAAVGGGLAAGKAGGAPPASGAAAAEVGATGRGPRRPRRRRGQPNK